MVTGAPPWWSFHRRTNRESANSPPRAGSDVLCRICASRGDETLIPIEKSTPRCQNDRTICKRCMQRHIREAVLKEHYEDIKCFCSSDGCTTTLKYDDVRKNATNETFREYDQGLLRQVLRLDPAFAGVLGRGADGPNPCRWR
mmetsp:Transcript_19579/g.45590  ORF Transcript_19579/g.45590 Transcript_19579/m.45590 type:complete len:143 (+) Transcript_19579:97-525(+)